jgi:hypothetical protein
MNCVPVRLPECRRRRFLVWIARGTLCAIVAAAAGEIVVAQNAVDTALSFYSHGGAYCFRVVPEGTSLAEEREWTVMMLTSTANRRNTYKIRSVDPGDTGLSGSGLMTAGRLANDVFKFDGTRSDFFDRFAEGIRAGRLRARVVKTGPSNLADLSERVRAEEYLKFAERGARVSFDKAHDLTADEFLAFSDYLPD